MDKSGSNLAALEAVNAGLETAIRIRQYRCLSNTVEQDLRVLKRIMKPMPRFNDLRCARINLSGIEITHMIRKEQMHGNDVSKSATAQFHSLVI